MERTIPPDTQPSSCIKKLIAELEECDPSQLGDLSTAVDTGELNTLTNPPPNKRTEERRSIGFVYCGYQTEVNSDRTLYIEK
ncbi:HalOD1 output domain-containing protein [Saliphagus infecundisoli]|uniref:HalOD1 output domain-containing protein n=2 Tax=Saliphagus infecundisoli TaxID=1849069 RepID=A0ABD5QHX8_9EURY